MSHKVSHSSSRRASRKVSRTLHAGGEHTPRLSPARQARAELHAQDLEMELYEDLA